MSTGPHWVASCYILCRDFPCSGLRVLFLRNISYHPLTHMNPSIFHWMRLSPDLIDQGLAQKISWQEFELSNEELNEIDNHFLGLTVPAGYACACVFIPWESASWVRTHPHYIFSRFLLRAFTFNKESSEPMTLVSMHIFLLFVKGLWCRMKW